MVLVDPPTRDGTVSSKFDLAPCGGAGKGLSHSLVDPDSYHPVTWTTLTPSQGANCTVRLLFSDLAYQTLALWNDKTDSSGWFPCARKQSQYESVSVVIPKQVKCSDCTLQFIFKTFQGSSFQCADISINSLASQSCAGKCKNKGACEENLCVCAKGYTGTYCEIKNDGEESSNILAFIVFILLLVTASDLLAIWFYLKNPDRIPLSAKVLISRISGEGDKEGAVRREHIAVDIHRESSNSSI